MSATKEKNHDKIEKGMRKIPFLEIHHDGNGFFKPKDWTIVEYSQEELEEGVESADELVLRVPLSEVPIEKLRKGEVTG